MTLGNIAIYLALIVFVIARRMIGRPVGPVKKQFALPVIAIVIGWGDAAKGLHKPLDIAFTVIGCAISLALGLARGGADRMSIRDGAPYVQWTWLSLGLFAANLLIKLGLDLAGVAAGETTAAATRSLILSLGLTLLGEAAVIWYRSGGARQLSAGRPANTQSGNADYPVNPVPVGPSGTAWGHITPGPPDGTTRDGASPCDGAPRRNERHQHHAQRHQHARDSNFEC